MPPPSPRSDSLAFLGRSEIDNPAREAVSEWPICNHDVICQRYNRIARPGGRLVIMDARLPPGLFGKLIRPFATWLMKQTLLGNPFIQPWQRHAALVGDFHIEDFRFGSYYICCGTKPEVSLTDRRLLPASRRPRANHRSPSQRGRRKSDKLKTGSGQRQRH